MTSRFCTAQCGLELRKGFIAFWPSFESFSHKLWLQPKLNRTNLCSLDRNNTCHRWKYRDGNTLVPTYILGFAFASTKKLNLPRPRALRPTFLSIDSIISYIIELNARLSPWEGVPYSVQDINWPVTVSFGARIRPWDAIVAPWFTVLIHERQTLDWLTQECNWCNGLLRLCLAATSSSSSTLWKFSPRTRFSSWIVWNFALNHHGFSNLTTFLLQFGSRKADSYHITKKREMVNVKYDDRDIDITMFSYLAYRSTKSIM